MFCFVFNKKAQGCILQLFYMWTVINDKECNVMQLFSFGFYFKYVLNLQFKVCNDDFLSARLHETQSELKPVWAYALG